MEHPLDREEWLEKAMAQWEVPLLRTCYLLLRDAALAEDAVQDTFVKAWKAWDHYRGEASEKTWLMRIAVNCCRDIRRGRWFLHIDRKINSVNAENLGLLMQFKGENRVLGQNGRIQET